MAKTGRPRKTQTKTSNTKNGRQNILTALLIVGLLILFIGLLRVNENRRSQNANGGRPPVTEGLAPTRTEKELDLPQGWRVKPSASDRVEVRVEKQVREGEFVPSVVLIRNQAEVGDPNEYTYRLIQGAYSAIPALSYSKDFVTTKDNYYLRVLGGSHVSNGQAVNLEQRIYVRRNTVYTMTGSFTGPGLSEEVQDIFDSLYGNYLR